MQPVFPVVDIFLQVADDVRSFSGLSVHHVEARVLFRFEREGEGGGSTFVFQYAIIAERVDEPQLVLVVGDGDRFRFQRKMRRYQGVIGPRRKGQEKLDPAGTYREASVNPVLLDGDEVFGFDRHEVEKHGFASGGSEGAGKNVRVGQIFLPRAEKRFRPDAEISPFLVVEQGGEYRRRVQERHGAVIDGAVG